MSGKQTKRTRAAQRLAGITPDVDQANKVTSKPVKRRKKSKQARSLGFDPLSLEGMLYGMRSMEGGNDA